VELHVIDAPYGHDCFLLEETRQTPLIQQFLGGYGGSLPRGIPLGGGAGTRKSFGHGGRSD
jgi:hypothetical protein